ncbi:MAG: hypothetical protein HUJ99_08570 [Bacteroidaceae bacterium]|nr:hypothetical protein [Bacteroidaceae bacterium]
MKKLILSLALLLNVCAALACTSAIISGAKTANGRPILWKHRDTGEENNKIERIEATATTLAYIALFNASDQACQDAWMGYNSAGFALMNTASYNLKDDDVPTIEMDKEGVLMRKALGVCKTVDDFEAFLKNYPKPMGVEANFGVIDALGNGAYFETNNSTYTRFDLKDAPDGVLIRTNYSFTGREGEGKGYIRYENAKHLLAKHIEACDITPAVLTEEVSRSYYHSLLQVDYGTLNMPWVVDQDFIPRRTSTATIAIEGVMPGEDVIFTTMWVGLGFPPCAEIRPVWLWDGGLPDELRGIGEYGHSPLCDAAVARKHEVFSIERGSGQQYLNLGKLYNYAGTGYCQQLVPKNLELYKQGYEILEQKRQDQQTKR